VWVNVVTAALALKSFRGQVTRAEVMLESRKGSGFKTKSTKSDLDSFW
jgi:ribosomal protein S21